MKKSVSYFLILNLFLSIIALGFVYGAQQNFEIRHEGKTYNIKANNADEAYLKLLEDLKKEKPTPPISSLPVSGYSGKFVKAMGGNPYPKDSVLYDGKWIDPKNLPKGVTASGLEKASGAGYSTAGILQGAAWAIAVVGAVQMIAPFAGANSQQTNAISTAMGMGTFTGKK